MSGASIGANIEEALAGHSRNDFIAKMNISLKEARETGYWLRLIRDSELVPIQKLHYTSSVIPRLDRGAGQ